MDFMRSNHELGRLEKGFIVLILVLVLLAGAFAWRAGQNKEAEINSFAECVAAGNPVMESYPERCAANGQSWSNPDQVIPEATSEDEAKEMVINELGVKFELTDDLDGLYYYIDPERPNAAYFSIEEFKGTDCSAEQISIAALSRSTNDDIAADELLASSKDFMKQIGEYYYLAQGAQAACSQDPAVQTRAGIIRSEILRVLPSELESL